MPSFFLSGVEQSEQFGAALSILLAPGDVLALKGDLGAGKTTLTRGLIGALCGAGTEVPSPTYTLVQTYDAPSFTLWHFDLYRLEHEDEVFELGWTETADGVAVVEWPDRAGRHLPKNHLTVRLETVGDGRRVTLEPAGEDWQKRLHGFDFKSA